MSKHFIISPEKTDLSNEDWESINASNHRIQQKKPMLILDAKQEALLSNIRPAPGKMIITIDENYKNTHQLTTDVQIIIQRNTENLNRRYTMPVNAVVLYSDKLPKGTEVLVHHNSFDPNHELFDVFPLDGKYENGGVKVFSIFEYQCFLYRKGEDWLPCQNFATALRIFKPVKTVFEGILPDLVKDMLFVQSGQYKDKVCMMLSHSDYEIIFNGTDGREKRIIRIVNFEDEDNPKNEIIAIDHAATQQVLNGELLVGLEAKDAKPIHIWGGKITSSKK